MNLSRFLFAGSLVAGIFMAGSPAQAAIPHVTWSTNAARIIIGSGCNALNSATQDTWVIANGNDISIVFTRLKVDLPGGGPDGALAGRRNCVIRLPVSIDRGFYPKELAQNLSIRVTKSEDVDVDGAAFATFFTQPAASARVHASKGTGTALTGAQLTASTYSQLNSDAFCAPNAALNGFFQANISLSGTRESAADNLVIGIDGVDSRWDITVNTDSCP